MRVDPGTAPVRIGIILAGGLSRRMGKDKALLILNGNTLLNHTANVLENSGCTNIILSGHSRSGFHGTTLPDNVADAGPVAGIISSLAYIAQHFAVGTECVFIAVDMPKASSTLIRSLVEDSMGYEAAYFEDYPLPFCLRLSNAVIQNTTTWQPVLSSGKSPSIRSFLSPLKTVLLQPSADQLLELINVNTPDAWKKLNNSM